MEGYYALPLSFQSPKRTLIGCNISKYVISCMKYLVLFIAISLYIEHKICLLI